MANTKRIYKCTCEAGTVDMDIRETRNHITVKVAKCTGCKKQHGLKSCQNLTQIN